jgi:hypothetical protein
LLAPIYPQHNLRHFCISETTPKIAAPRFPLTHPFCLEGFTPSKEAVLNYPGVKGQADDCLVLSDGARGLESESK